MARPGKGRRVPAADPSGLLANQHVRNGSYTQRDQGITEQ